MAKEKIRPVTFTLGGEPTDMLNGVLLAAKEENTDTDFHGNPKTTVFRK